MKAFYLEGINPLRSLDQAELVSRIEQGERGYYSLLQWTYRAFEKRDPIVRAVKRRLMSALGALKWDIRLADTGEDAAAKQMAERQAETLRSAYDGIENLQAALAFLALAELRGFSHLEKIYRGGVLTTDDTDNTNKNSPSVPSVKSVVKDSSDPWDIVELRPVEQWFWARRGLYGPWLYNPDARETNSGEPIDPAHYVIRAIDDPADEIFAEYGTKRRVNDADWDGFLEDYGVPAQFIVLPPNVPKDREAEYQRAAELAVSASRGSLPNGSSLLSPSAAGAGGAGVFRERLDYIDGQIVIAGTSGKLTILTEAGSGTLAGEAQKDVFMDIAEAIANGIVGDMQKQFDQPLLERKHAGEPILAYFEYKAVDVKKSTSVLTDAKTAGEAGYEMSEEEISEKSGYQLTKKAEAASSNAVTTATPVAAAVSAAIPPAAGDTPATTAPAAAPEPNESAGVSVVAANLHLTEAFVAPAKSVIDDLLARAQNGVVSDSELLASAEEFLQRIPELAASTDASEVADALTSAMQAAAEKTLAGK